MLLAGGVSRKRNQGTVKRLQWDLAVRLFEVRWCNHFFNCLLMKVLRVFRTAELINVRAGCDKLLVEVII